MQEGLKSQRLKGLVTELGNIRGKHTELVTVYVPAGFNLAVVVNQLRQEQSTAMNIKSKTVRKNVTGALEKILGHLKLYRKTPDNGLAIFCGNVSEREGVSDIELWAIEPPEPVKSRLYRCDQTFILDPLSDMIREREVYGLVVLDKSEASIGVLKGKSVEMLKHMTSLVPGKTKAGGQSAARFARVREGLLFDFLKKIGEVATAQFKELKDLKGIIIGGPGPIKEQFAEGEFLAYDLKQKVLGIVPTAYTGEFSLKEVVERSEDILEKASVMKEKRVLDAFFEHFAKDTGLATYGLHQVMDAMSAGNLDTLLVSETFDYVRALFECSCGHKEEKILRREELKEQKCASCGAIVGPTAEKDLLDEMLKSAEQMGTKVEMISSHTRKGQQLKEMGGIAGILRFKP
jgi:peptide chain release factor subunit 1